MILRLERKRRESLIKRFSLSVSSFRVLKVDPKVCRERFVLLLRSEEEMCVFFVCVQKESLFQVSTLYKVGTYLGCVSPYKGTLCFLFLCFKVVLTN